MRRISKRSKRTTKRKKSRRSRSSRKIPITNSLFTPGAVLTSKGIMPQVLKMKFTYSETVTLTSTLGVQNSYIVRGNAPFDPNQSSTGQQPPGFDQMAAWYQWYSVYQSAIDVDYITSSSNPTYLTLGVNVAATANSLSYDTSFSIPNFKRAIMPSNQSGGKFRMKNRITTKNANGNSVDDKDNHGTFSSNPGTQYYWIITVQPSDGTTQTYLITYAVTYYCVLFGRLPLINS